MKKKFIIITLCFTLFFTSINYKKSYADGGIISLPILATVASLAVATGITLQGADDIYDVGYLFYDKYKSRWDEVKTIFNISVALNESTKQVTVGKNFLDLVKECFDSAFYSDTVTPSHIYLEGLPVFPDYKHIPLNSVVEYYNFGIKTYMSGTSKCYDLMLNGSKIDGGTYGVLMGLAIYDDRRVAIRMDSGYKYMDIVKYNPGIGSLLNQSSVALPHGGTYNPGDTFDKDIGIWVPGNLGDLVGGNVKPGDITSDKAPGWVGNGDITIPNVDNPSIDIDKDTTFPNVDTGIGNPSIPNEGIFATIKEFIISLVVPSDMFWTDTFNGFRDSFGNAFPMIDMGKFNDLIVEGKPFPNIDVNIMGVKGRVVSGDTINSIVDWLRPIVAGFMMLCLMLFNYRKIYKLIRNSEPFGGIAPGSSDFRTGISEYQHNLDSARSTIRSTMQDMIGGRK